MLDLDELLLRLLSLLHSCLLYLQCQPPQLPQYQQPQHPLHPLSTATISVTLRVTNQSVPYTAMSMIMIATDSAEMNHVTVRTLVLATTTPHLPHQTPYLETHGQLTLAVTVPLKEMTLSVLMTKQIIKMNATLFARVRRSRAHLPAHVKWTLGGEFQTLDEERETGKNVMTSLIVPVLSRVNVL